MKDTMKSYAGTNVHWGKSQSDMLKLLKKYDITDVQFTNIGYETAINAGLVMQKDTTAIMLLFQKRVQLEDGRSGNIPVRVVIPNVPEDDKKLNQYYRVLYWYLKSKFEAIDTGLVEFAEEFMAHLQIEGKNGVVARMWDTFRKGYYKAIGDGTQGNAGLLPPVAGRDDE